MATQHGYYQYTFRDEFGTLAQLRIYAQMDDTANLGNQLANIESTGLGLLLDGMSGAQIQSAKLVVEASTSGLKTAPIAGSRAEQGALFNTLNATTPRRFGLWVPALRDTVIVNGKVDLTNANVSGFITQLTNPLSAAECESPSQYVISAVRDVLISFRKQRRQLSRASVEAG